MLGLVRGKKPGREMIAPRGTRGLGRKRSIQEERKMKRSHGEEGMRSPEIV